ncbi:hypothetical protein V4C53_11695 [Paraburkholderia azotifigens]|uniref:hypothetical protein n=1 Tax=Paraburkholderia azotifigens TaxID=2057004 RepID=UPI003178608F
MKVRIANEGETPVRVIVDHDTVNDHTLDAGAEAVFEAGDPDAADRDSADGVIELRELGAGVVADEGSTDA